MLLVTILHATNAIGVPTNDELTKNPLLLPTLEFFKTISIGCVDIFVIITGWFGIRPNIKSFASFIFQCLYFLLGVYLVCCILHLDTFSFSGLMSCFLFIPDWDYWFIKCYILLYILSPVLNVFIEHTSEKTFRYLLIAFFLYVFIYDWFYISVNGLEGGYSTIFMIGLYLLARYCRIYQHKIFNLSVCIDFLILISIVVMVTLISTASVHLGIPEISGKLIGSYVTPFVVFYSLWMVVLFSKLKLQSKLINLVAKSCFAVYLFHTHVSLFVPYYQQWIKNIYDSTTGFMTVLLIFCFIVFVYLCAILLDQPRKIICRKLLVTQD